jgi:hypothetical protein
VGLHDSSKTRVQPIFKELHALDPSGTSWLPMLLRFGGRGAPPADVGTLQSVEFEYSAAPPSSFLRWLVEHPSDLQQPTYAMSAAAREKREKVLGGDPTTIAEAIDAIDSGISHRGKWWCFEGTTMVDCALFTEGCIVFVEGKRTEAGASRAVSWYASRNQMLRNLDCARALATSDGRAYCTLLVIEQGEASDARLAAAHNVVDPDIVEKSLPHLSPAERSEALDHYLGFTTWQEIARSFELDPVLVAE